MAAAQYNLYIEQGSTFKLSLVWKDSAGVPIDLTDHEVFMQIRRSIGGTVIFDSETTGTITLEALTGKINIKIPANLTETFPSGQWFYDVELHDNRNTPTEVTRLLQGQAIVNPEVTKS